MKIRTISGIFKIILAILIVTASFASIGPHRPLSIWVGFVVAVPVVLWGVLDFVKKPENTEGEQENENDGK